MARFIQFRKSGIITINSETQRDPIKEEVNKSLGQWPPKTNRANSPIPMSPQHGIRTAKRIQREGLLSVKASNARNPKVEKY